MKKLYAILALVVLLSGCSLNSEVSNIENNVTDSGEKNIKVGVLQFADHPSLDRAREGFLKKLEDDGYEVEADVVNAQGDVTLIPQAANNMKSNKVDIIYAIGTPAAQGAMGQISDIPIVFSAVTDPVSAGLVKSNEKPGGNVTGASDYFSFETQLDLFLKDFPDVKTIGVLYSTGEANSEVQIEDMREVLKNKNMTLKEVGVTNSSDIPTALETLVGNVDAYFSITDNLTVASSSIIGKILLENKIISFAAERGAVENGLLLTDGIDYTEQGEAAAEQAIEILNGKNPADIPVYYTEKSERFVNENTKKELGVVLEK